MKKKFLKKSKMAAKIFKISRHLRFLQKLFFHELCVSITLLERKREWKKIQISQSYDEKSDFDPPSWIFFPLFASLDFLYSVYYNKTPMQKRKLKKVG